MKRKIFVILLILSISSVYAKSRRPVYTPIYSDEYLLNKCREYARFLGYDENEIIEAHYVTLPTNVMGKCLINDGIILINIDYKFPGWYEFHETLIHEICHLYSRSSSLEWHVAMIDAAHKIDLLETDILHDERTRHKLK